MSVDPSTAGFSPEESPPQTPSPSGAQTPVEGHTDEHNQAPTDTDTPTIDEQNAGGTPDGEPDAEAARDEALVQDIKDGAVTGTVPTLELFVPWRAIFAVNDVQYCKDFTGGSDTVNATLVFRCPHHQRSSIVLCVMFPRHPRRDNPKKLVTHSVSISFPVPAISNIQYTMLPEKTALSRDEHGLEAGEGFTRPTGELYQLAVLEIESRQVLISGGAIPPLLTPELDAEIQQMMAAMRTSGVRSKIVIRDSQLYTSKSYERFYQRMSTENVKDPAMAWVPDSPNAAALSMGNIVPLEDRPNIPSQHAETCFWDKMAYQIPVIYGAVFEDEFQELMNNELSVQRFQMQVIEAPNARNVLDTDVFQKHIMTTARVYLAFVNFSELSISRPVAGTRVKIQISLPREPAAAQGDAAAINAAPVENAPLEVTPPKGDPNKHAPTGRARPADEYDATLELGNEDTRDVFNDEDEDLEEIEDHLTWSGSIIEPTEITPPGYITIMLERRRVPKWTGPRHERPFVDIPLNTVNFRLHNTPAQLSAAILNGPRIDIRIATVYSKQGLKDMVRCADLLWRSPAAQHRRIRDGLLCHDVANSPFARTNVHAIIGTTKTNLHKLFNDAQLHWYQSLRDTPEYSLLHGPIGTGKTKVCVALTAEILSNPTVRNQVLYAVETHKAVDEVALRLEKVLSYAGLQKKILRLHSLPGEKSAMYSLYNQQNKPKERYVYGELDVMTTQLALVAYLDSMSDDYMAMRARGDPRRILDSMSLAGAMYRKLTTTSNENWIRLDSMLVEYGLDGFDAATRTDVKLALHELMAETLQEQDVIVCTLATTAKVKLAQHFNPVVTFLDEAGRVHEAKSIMIPAMYPNAQIHFLVGDHLQMGPFCSSFGRERDPEPFLNPFAPQHMLSGFERLIRNGAERTFLNLQHRCHGEIPDFVSKTFYHGELKTAPCDPRDLIKIKAIRNFVAKVLGAEVPTNRYLKRIHGSFSRKETGGTSSVNDIEASIMMGDLKKMSRDDRFKGLKVGVLSFYKGQLPMLKKMCAQLQANSTLDIHVMSVASCQGTEFDVTLLSFVRTRGVAFINEPHALLVSLSRSSKLLGMYASDRLVEDIEKVTSKNVFIMQLFEDLERHNHVIDVRA